MQDAKGVKYVGGEHYLDRVPTSFKFADLAHRLAEKANHSVSVRYQVPGEPLDEDELVAVTDDLDMEVSLLCRAPLTGLLSAARQPAGGLQALQIWRAMSEQQAA